ncbi:T9SS C-terminal target domain-containing protein [candidate division KSB1 bacterium]|nr:endo-1,4-beta-xylanase [candidate division KSB1 bacterium]RQW06337.1 MAG: T9SS C-terminal target domain-containing protein [candidate division KSB1 bacterium]
MIHYYKLFSKYFIFSVIIVTILIAGTTFALPTADKVTSTNIDKAGDTAVIVEAESGVLGSNFRVGQDGDITYVTTKTNYIGTTNPDDENSLITYNVTFEDSGYYNLFAHLRVGSGSYDDDSFFYARGFGEKNYASPTDWVFINGLAGAGFTSPSEVVDGPGVVGSQIWKWVNVTKNFYQGVSPANAFYVDIDNFSKTFQVAGREDGLEIDKFAFGKAHLYFTVEALENGLPGSTTKPEPDSSKFYKGPPLAEGSSKFLGNVKALNDNNYAYYWNQLTPGNEGKWGSVAGTSDTSRWNWSGLDALYNYAKQHNLIFKDHTLIWGNQQPSWISSLDSARQYKYIETWIRMVGKRYPDMDMIDVVNEPLAGHNPPDGGNNRANYKRALGGNGETGWDWVINSFILARKYLPNTKLLLNDYGIINDNSATTNYLKIISLLQDRGLLDGIGVQGHRFELENASTSTLKSNLDRLAATGLPIYISEMDLGNLRNEGTPNDDQQLQLYQRIFPILWEHPGVQGITLWGYLEGQMWQSSCYLVLRDGTWRPAMQWLAEYIKESQAGVEITIKALPADFQLKQNYPNPFNPTTTIDFSLPDPAHVTLKIYDILGREVVTLVNENLKPGVYNVTWDAKNSSGSNIVSGAYFYRLAVGNQTVARKMLLRK